MGTTNIGALSTGLLKITVAAGVATPSTAASGVDYVPVGTPACPTATEIGYVSGVTSAIQTQFTNKADLFNPAPANLGYSGVFATATAGDNVAIGDVCYLNSDGKFYLAKADVAVTKLPAVAMATGTISANATGVFLFWGAIRSDAGWGGALTVGGQLYVSITGTTGNTTTQTAPTANGNIVQNIGYALAARTVFFDGNRTVVTVSA